MKAKIMFSSLKATAGKKNIYNSMPLLKKK